VLIGVFSHPIDISFFLKAGDPLQFFHLEATETVFLALYELLKNLSQLDMAQLTYHYFTCIYAKP